MEEEGRGAWDGRMEGGKERGGEWIALPQMSQSPPRWDKPDQPIQKRHQMVRLPVQYCFRQRVGWGWRERKRESAPECTSHNEMWQINLRHSGDDFVLANQYGTASGVVSWGLSCLTRATVTWSVYCLIYSFIVRTVFVHFYTTVK